IPISAVALRGLTNERSEFLLTTLPVIPVGGALTSPVTIPHFADGGGWTTQVVLVSRSSSSSGTAQFFDRSGRLIRTMSYAVAAGSSVRMQTDGSGASTQTGSIVITPGVDAFSIVSYKLNGATVTTAGVPALPAGTAFLAYIENSGTIRSGIALANPSASPVTVSLEVLGKRAEVSLPANGQTAFFLMELPEFSGLPI